MRFILLALVMQVFEQGTATPCGGLDVVDIWYSHPAPCSLSLGQNRSIIFGYDEDASSINLCIVNQRDANWVALGASTNNAAEGDGGLAMENNIVSIFAGSGSTVSERKLGAGSLGEELSNAPGISEKDTLSTSETRSMCLKLAVDNLKTPNSQGDVNLQEASFIWAIGSSPALARHDSTNRGLISLDLTAGKIVLYKGNADGAKLCKGVECASGTVCNDKGSNTDVAGGNTVNHRCVDNAARMGEGEEYAGTKQLCFATDRVVVCSENTRCDEEKSGAASCVPTVLAYREVADGQKTCNSVVCASGTVCNDKGSNTDVAGGVTAQHVCVMQNARIEDDETTHGSKNLCFASDGLQLCNDGTKCVEANDKTESCVSVVLLYKENADGVKLCKNVQCVSGTVCNDKGSDTEVAGGITVDHICVMQNARMENDENYGGEKQLCFATDGVVMCNENTKCDEEKGRSTSCVSIAVLAYREEADGVKSCKDVQCVSGTVCNDKGSDTDVAGGNTVEHICVTQAARMGNNENFGGEKQLCFAADGVVVCNESTKCDEEKGKSTSCVATAALAYREEADGVKLCKDVQCVSGTVCNDKGSDTDVAGGNAVEHICVTQAARMGNNENYGGEKQLCFATDGVVMCNENTKCDEEKGKSTSCVSTAALAYREEADGVKLCKNVQCVSGTVCNDKGSDTDVAGGNTVEHICVTQAARMGNNENHGGEKQLCFATDGVVMCNESTKCDEEKGKSTSCVSTAVLTYREKADGVKLCKDVQCVSGTVCNDKGSETEIAGGNTVEHICVIQAARMGNDENYGGEKQLCFATDGVVMCNENTKCDEEKGKSTSCVSTAAALCTKSVLKEPNFATSCKIQLSDSQIALHYGYDTSRSLFHFCVVNEKNNHWVGFGPRNLDGADAMLKSVVVISENGRKGAYILESKVEGNSQRIAADLVSGSISDHVETAGSGNRTLCFKLAPEKLNGAPSKAKFIWARGDAAIYGKHGAGDSNRGELELNLEIAKLPCTTDTTCSSTQPCQCVAVNDCDAHTKVCSKNKIVDITENTQLAYKERSTSTKVLCVKNMIAVGAIVAGQLIASCSNDALCNPFGTVANPSGGTSHIDNIVTSMCVTASAKMSDNDQVSGNADLCFASNNVYKCEANMYCREDGNSHDTACVTSQDTTPQKGMCTPNHVCPEDVACNCNQDDKANSPCVSTNNQRQFCAQDDSNTLSIIALTVENTIALSEGNAKNKYCVQNLPKSAASINETPAAGAMVKECDDGMTCNPWCSTPIEKVSQCTLEKLCLNTTLIVPWGTKATSTSKMCIPEIGGVVECQKVCSARGCVDCTNDSHCPDQICHAVSQTCVPKISCSEDNENACTPPLRCLKHENKSNDPCKSGDTCICRVPSCNLGNVCLSQGCACKRASTVVDCVGPYQWCEVVENNSTRRRLIESEQDRKVAEVGTPLANRGDGDGVHLCIHGGVASEGKAALRCAFGTKCNIQGNQTETGAKETALCVNATAVQQHGEEPNQTKNDKICISDTFTKLCVGEELCNYSAKSENEVCIPANERLNNRENRAGWCFAKPDAAAKCSAAETCNINGIVIDAVPDGGPSSPDNICIRSALLIDDQTVSTGPNMICFGSSAVVPCPTGGMCTTAAQPSRGNTSQNACTPVANSCVANEVCPTTGCDCKTAGSGDCRGDIQYCFGGFGPTNGNITFSDRPSVLQHGVQGNDAGVCRQELASGSSANRKILVCGTDYVCNIFGTRATAGTTAWDLCVKSTSVIAKHTVALQRDQAVCLGTRYSGMCKLGQWCNSDADVSNAICLSTTEVLQHREKPKENLNILPYCFSTRGSTSKCQSNQYCNKFGTINTGDVCVNESRVLKDSEAPTAAGRNLCLSNVEIATCGNGTRCVFAAKRVGESCIPTTTECVQNTPLQSACKCVGGADNAPSVFCDPGTKCMQTVDGKPECARTSAPGSVRQCGTPNPQNATDATNPEECKCGAGANAPICGREETCENPESAPECTAVTDCIFTSRLIANLRACRCGQQVCQPMVTCSASNSGSTTECAVVAPCDSTDGSTSTHRDCKCGHRVMRCTVNQVCTVDANGNGNCIGPVLCGKDPDACDNPMMCQFSGEHGGKPLGTLCSVDEPDVAHHECVCREKCPLKTKVTHGCTCGEGPSSKSCDPGSICVTEDGKLPMCKDECFGDVGCDADSACIRKNSSGDEALCTLEDASCRCSNKCLPNDVFVDASCECAPSVKCQPGEVCDSNARKCLKLCPVSEKLKDQCKCGKSHRAPECSVGDICLQSIQSVPGLHASGTCRAVATNACIFTDGKTVNTLPCMCGSSECAKNQLCRDAQCTSIRTCSNANGTEPVDVECACAGSTNESGPNPTCTPGQFCKSGVCEGVTFCGGGRSDRCGANLCLTRALGQQLVNDACDAQSTMTTKLEQCYCSEKCPSDRSPVVRRCTCGPLSLLCDIGQVCVAPGTMKAVHQCLRACPMNNITVADAECYCGSVAGALTCTRGEYCDHDIRRGKSVCRATKGMACFMHPLFRCAAKSLFCNNKNGSVCTAEVRPGKTSATCECTEECASDAVYDSACTCASKKCEPFSSCAREPGSACVQRCRLDGKVTTTQCTCGFAVEAPKCKQYQRCVKNDTSGDFSCIEVPQCEHKDGSALTDRACRCDLNNNYCAPGEVCTLSGLCHRAPDCVNGKATSLDSFCRCFNPKIICGPKMRCLYDGANPPQCSPLSPCSSADGSNADELPCLCRELVCDVGTTCVIGENTQCEPLEDCKQVIDNSGVLNPRACKCGRTGNETCSAWQYCVVSDDKRHDARCESLVSCTTEQNGGNKCVCANDPVSMAGICTKQECVRSNSSSAMRCSNVPVCKDDGFSVTQVCRCGAEAKACQPGQVCKEEISACKHPEPCVYTNGLRTHSIECSCGPSGTLFTQPNALCKEDAGNYTVVSAAKKDDACGGKGINFTACGFTLVCQNQDGDECTWDNLLTDCKCIEKTPCGGANAAFKACAPSEICQDPDRVECSRNTDSSNCYCTSKFVDGSGANDGNDTALIVTVVILCIVILFCAAFVCFSVCKKKHAYDTEGQPLRRNVDDLERMGSAYGAGFGKADKLERSPNNRESTSSTLRRRSIGNIATSDAASPLNLTPRGALVSSQRTPERPWFLGRAEEAENTFRAPQNREPARELEAEKERVAKRNWEAALREQEAKDRIERRYWEAALQTEVETERIQRRYQEIAQQKEDEKDCIAERNREIAQQKEAEKERVEQKFRQTAQAKAAEKERAARWEDIQVARLHREAQNLANSQKTGALYSSGPQLVAFDRNFQVPHGLVKPQLETHRTNVHQEPFHSNYPRTYIPMGSASPTVHRSDLHSDSIPYDPTTRAWSAAPTIRHGPERVQNLGPVSPSSRAGAPGSPRSYGASSVSAPPPPALGSLVATQDRFPASSSASSNLPRGPSPSPPVPNGNVAKGSSPRPPPTQINSQRFFAPKSPNSALYYSR